MNEEIEEIKRLVTKHKDSVDLYIKRMPSNVKELFIKFANDEFVGDYGMAFKKILEDYFIQGEQINTFLSIFDEHEQRISQLENKKQEDRIDKKLSGIRTNFKKRLDGGNEDE